MQFLTPEQRRFLKAKAHGLRPVVLLGEAGLTEAVLAEIFTHLRAHELVKVKVAGKDRATRETIFATICERLDAAQVEHIGKMLVLYRPAEKPRLVLPGGKIAKNRPSSASTR